MNYPQLPIFSLLAAILVLVPLSWHLRARNVATIALMLWLSVVNLIYGVNSLVWAGNVNNPIPVWCDITTKIVVGASYALPLCTLCICKHLEMVSSSRKVSYDSSDRRRRMIFEIVLCFVVPGIFMALHYIVQGHRFDIFEDIGCQAAMYISLPAVLLIWFPQLLFSIITLIFASLALVNFLRRRLTFAAHLQRSNSALTTNRYMRLILMSTVQMVWGTTLTSYNLANNIHVGLRPYTSWGDVHSDWNRADAWRLDELPGPFVDALFVLWWAMPVSAFIFFVFFGFGEEARKEYARCWAWCRRVVLRREGGAEDKKGLPFANSRAPKPLHLLSLKKTNTLSSTMSTSISSHSKSPSEAFHSKPTTSVSSHFSQSTVTLASSPTSGAFNNGTLKKSKSYTPSEAAPDYYASYPWSAPQPQALSMSLPRSTTLALPSVQTLIGQPIQARPTPSTTNADTHPEDAHPQNPDDSFASSALSFADNETFTISTFSYYENISSMPMPMSMPSSPAPAVSVFVPHPLPAPPRRSPGPLAKLDSRPWSVQRVPVPSASSLPSTSSSTSLSMPAFAPGPMPAAPLRMSLDNADVPEDVGSFPVWYTQTSTLGVSGGGIHVTIERKASVDDL